MIDEYTEESQARQAPQVSPSTAIGPYSSLLPGPMCLRLDLDPAGDGSPLGWGVVMGSMELETGYNSIGLEERISSGGLPWDEVMPVLEELCGCCSQSTTLAFVEAVESMASLVVPPRAAYLRLVLVEVERVVSHLLNAAEMLDELGMSHRASSLRDLRERTIHAMAEWSGARFQPGLIAFGGLSRHIDEATSKELLVALRPVERALRAEVPLIINSREVAERLAGLGAIRLEQAAATGLRGPNARASGLADDIRSSVPTGAYEEEAVTIVVQRAGDAYARLVVRLLEALESFRVVEQALDDLPTGPVKTRVSLEMRTGSGIGRVEGPRGETFCWIQAGEKGLVGLHLSTGSFPVLGILEGFLPGKRLDDLRLLLLSLDICMGCVER
ncbi:MAG TPA: hypothetical protein VM409_07600 [Chloroflexia bacterium]|nr:hypothetical protein [Chloroflexia bacterium]